MPVERRGWVIAFEIGSTGNGRNPIFNGRRQPSCGGTSRMTRECQVRICERLGVKFPGPTRPKRREAFAAICPQLAKADVPPPLPRRAWVAYAALSVHKACKQSSSACAQAQAR